MATLFAEHVARALGGADEDSRRMLPVIEKEILHHDIIRSLHEQGFLAKLAFFGGTNLRLCHGASRCSEDLDFKGSPLFAESLLSGMADCLSTAFKKRYGLESRVTPPKRTEGNTRTWSIQIMTRPDSKSGAQQTIHIDVCTLACHEHRPRLLANHYAVDLGTTGLLIASQSLRESYTDKLIAIALRNRLMPRDVWDLAWLRQNPANAVPVALESKLAEHSSDLPAFEARIAARSAEIATPAFHAIFVKELERFLPTRLIPTMRDPALLAFVADSVNEGAKRLGRNP